MFKAGIMALLAIATGIVIGSAIYEYVKGATATA